MSLNIREAEERARQQIANWPLTGIPMERDFLDLLALYREAVGALGAIHYDSDGIPFMYPSRAYRDAVLSKAREAGVR